MALATSEAAFGGLDGSVRNQGIDNHIRVWNGLEYCDGKIWSLVKQPMK
jgi:hypothetical protein